MNSNLLNQLDEFKNQRHEAFVSAFELKSEGKKIAGVYGENVPREILWALDIIPINIYGIDGSNIEAAEKFIDKKSCSLLKASYGYILTDRCPFSHFADIIIGTNYCFDKECMINKLENIKQVYIIKEHKNAADLVSEYKDFIYYLQQKYSIDKFDEDKFVKIVKNTNNISKLVHEITDIYMKHPYIMGSNDLLNIIYGSQFIFDLDERLYKLQQLKEALDMALFEHPVTFNKGSILITGVPLGGLNDGIIKPLSSLNISVLTLSRCEGENYKIVDDFEDLYFSLAQKYIAVNSQENLNRIISKYNIVAIVNLKIQGCEVQSEEYSALGIPYLPVNIDYNCDYEKIAMKIKSFINKL
ncbi:MAG: 2-hydroxyacyl-CoA dehydratase family protein [Sedimentibacter sp.]|uniref:2-hydroxyacyl-CoA dehydratase family protein n=1 Tax=Sedimentibacter sp. TaxID=1960295 RepID=UPI0031592784